MPGDGAVPGGSGGAVAAKQPLKPKKPPVPKLVNSQLQEENKKLKTQIDEMVTTMRQLKTVVLEQAETIRVIQNKVASPTTEPQPPTGPEGDGVRNKNEHERRHQKSADSEQPKSAPVNLKEPAPPPVHIFDSDSQAIKRVLTFNLRQGEFSLRKTKDSINVKFIDMDKYKKGCKILEDRKIHYFTYTPKGEKLSKFVLKGLDQYDPKEILEEINASGAAKKAIKVVSMRSSKVKDFYIVTFEQGTKLQDLKPVRSLFEMMVRFEKLRPRGILQCFNCQRYGHATANCHLKARCVKCGEEHSAKECPIQGKEGNANQLRCCLCGEPGHPASYRKCDKFVDLQRVIEERRARKEIRSGKTNFSNKNILENSNFPPLPGQHNNRPVSSGTNLNNFNNVLKNQDNSNDMSEIKDLLLRISEEQYKIREEMLTLAVTFGTKLSMSQDEISEIFK